MLIILQMNSDRLNLFLKDLSNDISHIVVREKKDFYFTCYTAEELPTLKRFKKFNYVFGVIHLYIYAE